MKKILIFAIVLCSSYVTIAQVKFGIRGGITSTDFNPKELIVLNQNDVEQLKISVDEASYGYHFGLFAQFRKDRWFIQPEVLFNSNKISYNVDDNILSTVKNEKFNFVDIPINVAYKVGPLRIQAGPVGHFFVNSKSELKTLEGYKENFADMAWGVQYGLGLDIWKTVLDFKWERNFKNYGDHVVFDDTSYNFDSSPNRFIVSLGVKF
ncbi:MAG: outer membrane beta-barrel protein [Saprospiraceae bacterium]